MSKTSGHQGLQTAPSQMYCLWQICLCASLIAWRQDWRWRSFSKPADEGPDGVGTDDEERAEPDSAPAERGKGSQRQPASTAARHATLMQVFAPGCLRLDTFRLQTSSSMMLKRGDPCATPLDTPAAGTSFLTWTQDSQVAHPGCHSHCCPDSVHCDPHQEAACTHITKPLHVCCIEGPLCTGTLCYPLSQSSCHPATKTTEIVKDCTTTLLHLNCSHTSTLPARILPVKSVLTGD